MRLRPLKLVKLQDDIREGAAYSKSEVMLFPNKRNVINSELSMTQPIRSPEKNFERPLENFTLYLFDIFIIIINILSLYI